MTPYRISIFAFCLIATFIVSSCKDNTGGSATVADSPGQMQAKSTKLLEKYLDAVLTSENKELDSGIIVRQSAIAKALYEENDFEPLWCKKQEWLPIGDSLANFISRARYFGLFPQHYHQRFIDTVRKFFAADSLSEGARKNVDLWAKTDLLLTDAFIQIANDIKLGRIAKDSITLRKDSVISATLCKDLYSSIKKSTSVTTAFEKLEPSNPDYQALKSAIPSFLSNFDDKQYTFVPSKTDSLKFVKALHRRLFEGGFISFIDKRIDSLTLAAGIIKFQRQKGIAADGRAGDGTVRALNSSDEEKFYRIAISMDRYKNLPDKMPDRYIWVNAASNYMYVKDGADIPLTSKVICGRPKTRTPVLNSVLKEIITYPQWVPPPSIVLKEILPALKRNPGYLSRRGFSLETWGGKKLDPYSINWSKFSKAVPYKIVQGSSDGNALGVMKFVFDNDYSVYLHDTNQRYLFNSNNRSLSHGCVRVQDWDKLARYLISVDSIHSSAGKYTSSDSLTSWLTAKKRKSVVIKTPVNVYIRYITCEGKDGKIVFYEDVYDEDKLIREKYFNF